MKLFRFAVLVALAASLIPGPGQAAINPQDPNLSCGYRCSSRSCVKDINTSPRTYCIINWDTTGCSSGLDTSVCTPPGGG